MVIQASLAGDFCTIIYLSCLSPWMVVQMWPRKRCTTIASTSPQDVAGGQPRLHSRLPDPPGRIDNCVPDN